MNSNFFFILFFNIGLVVCKGKDVNQNIDQNTETVLPKSEIAKKQNELIDVLKNAKSTEEVLIGYGVRDLLKLIKRSPITGSSTYGIAPKPGQSLDSSTSVEFTEYECAIRPRIVDVDFVPGYFTFPACIQVNECSGCTTKSLIYKCVPDEQVNVIANVVDIDYSGGFRIRKVTTLQPKSCKMECRIKASDCTPGQVYDPNSCTCSCSSSIEKCPVGKQWSIVNCACACSEVKTCSSNKIWNKDSCTCQCIPKVCLPSQKQDLISCNCV
ncbi:vascular endothelial growth factor C [Hydra vulgaris]|uniref:vascular endothelial growth factor C n=1 Tax=Hydra vulgaris TaxID=6087 RepID=UPI0001925676|nr:vascular endothelial growth factor C [Hydra vulgaris]